MEINHKFLEAVSPVLSELREKLGCDFVVFGSAPLYLLGVVGFRGLEDLNDLDIAVGDDFAPTEEMREVLFHDNPAQKFYKLSAGGINVDIGTVWPGREKIYEKIFSNAFEYGGFRFASLNVVRGWKEMMVREYGREKDKAYLEKIRQFQARKAQAIRITDAKADEAGEIRRLMNDVWIAAYSNREHGIGEADIRSRQSADLEKIKRMKELIGSGSVSGHIWVAKDGGEIIGMCSADRGDRNKLGALYILPSYQQIGVGSRLIGKALEWLGEGKPVYLEVVEFNTGVIEFYRKSGFEVEGKADDYVFPAGKSMPLLWMVKYFREG